MGSWLSRHPVAADVLVAAVAVAGLLADVALAGPAGSARGVAAALAIVMGASLAGRRRAPLASYVVGTAALALQAVFVYTSELYPYANLLGIYSAALYAPRRQAQLALAVGLSGVLAFFSAYPTESVILPLVIGLVWSGAWAAGYAVTRRREDAAAAHSAAVGQAAIDERGRIARELHDLIGHTLNVMVVQAGAARTVLDRDPDRARRSLQTLEDVGRGALDELDRVLGVLRDDTGADADGQVAWQPQAGLADLDALAERFRQTGLPVELSVRGTPPPGLPRSLEVSAYRIVQEALTNTLKHAGAATARVTVTLDLDAVDIVVCDDGTGGADALPGRGLTGMAERVAVFGGRLDHRGGPDGFRVRAVLPVQTPEGARRAAPSRRTGPSRRSAP